MYSYGLRMRPFDIGTVPMDSDNKPTLVDSTDFKYGIVQYEEELTDEEVAKYELTKIAQSIYDWKAEDYDIIGILNVPLVGVTLIAEHLATQPEDYTDRERYHRLRGEHIYGITTIEEAIDEANEEQVTLYRHLLKIMERRDASFLRIID